MRTSDNPIRIGRVGVWSGELRFSAPEARAEAVAELEGLGYGAAWMPGGAGGDILEVVQHLLSQSSTITIATGILNVWKHEAADVGAWWRALPADQQARTLLGLGISHGPMIGDAYAKPVATMSAYIDKLAAEGIPANHLCLAALGPKMQELSKAKTAGAHPYLVTPEHTAQVRANLGAGPLVAVEQTVILETDPDKARDLARKALAIYLNFPNYVNNWRRLGFSEEDVTGPSDKLVDALFAWGDEAKIAERVAAHFDAGADHVCLQVVRSAERGDVSLLRDSWRRLAKILL